MARPANRITPAAMTRPHPILSLVLALALIIAQASGAVARVQQATGTVVELCAGTGSASVLLDAQGKRVAALHTCPHCLGALTGCLPVAVAGAVAPADFLRLRVARAGDPSHLPEAPQATPARAPPLSV